MSAKLKVAVLGATGYSGLELTRLLLRHPLVDKPVLLRRPESQNPTLPEKRGRMGHPLKVEMRSISRIFFLLSPAMDSTRLSRSHGRR